MGRPCGNARGRMAACVRPPVFLHSELLGGSPLRYAYLGLFTLTDAQHAKALLDRKGIRSRVGRMPSAPGVSCSFGLKLASGDAGKARSILEENRLRLGKTVYRKENGESSHDLL